MDLHDDGHFAKHIGVEIIEITPDRVRARLAARPGLANRRGILHGGAIMSLADHMGGIGTTANLPQGSSTTTTESKTNFFSPVPHGDQAHADCTPLHRGRSTMVWEASITPGDGTLAAMVTLTQPA